MTTSSYGDGIQRSYGELAGLRLLDDLVSAIDNGWGTNAPYPAQRLDRAIEIYDATEEKYDDRP